MMSRVDTVKAYLMGLQNRITSAIAGIDGGEFLVDSWAKAPGETLQGNGITQILEGGAVFERAGCGFSHVRGPRLPPSATQHRPELTGAPFEAVGLSLVFHPRNPYVPTVHMNVRMLSAASVGASGERVETTWFGGGMDLTPYYGFGEAVVKTTLGKVVIKDAAHAALLLPVFKAKVVIAPGLEPGVLVRAKR